MRSLRAGSCNRQGSGNMNGIAIRAVVDAPLLFSSLGASRIGLRPAICERSTGLIFAKRLGLISASRPESYELDRQVMVSLNWISGQ